MIAVDTSTLVAFLGGEEGGDVTAFMRALARDQVCLPPVVVSELLSAPEAPRIERWIVNLPILVVTDGFWQRAGLLRRKILARRLAAPLADTLIAQTCIDHDVSLVTRDNDFRRYVKHGGLVLAAV